MKLINNTKIGVRLGIVFTLIVVVTTLGFAYLSFQTRSIKQELDKIYKVNLMGMEYLIEADRDAYQSSVAISQLINLGDTINPGDKSYLITAVEENLAQVEQRYSKFENVSDILHLGEYKAINNKFHDNYSRIQNQTNQIVRFLKNSEYKKVKEIYFGEYTRAFDEMRGAMDQFTGISLENASSAYDQSITLSNKILYNSIIITIIIIIFIIISAILLTKSISKPLKYAVDSLSNIANGDLRVDLSNELNSRKDEVGILLQSISQMTGKLNTMISDIKLNVSQFTTASQVLNTTSQHLSDGANHQASAVEEVSSTLDQISEIIEKNTNNALETQKISSISEKGIENMNKSSRDSLKSISEISGKITVINDIAFQTNILALNAAVEAARAGEHGKGFAVVAAEVRKLAERSKIAADEIINLSATSVKITREAVAQMETIMPEIAKTSKLVQEIAALSQEQSNGTTQVSSSIQQLNDVTQQNASAAEELASNAQELQAQADSLMEVVSLFRTK